MALKGQRFQYVDEIKHKSTELLREISIYDSRGVSKSSKDVGDAEWIQKEPILLEI